MWASPIFLRLPRLPRRPRLVVCCAELARDRGNGRSSSLLSRQPRFVDRNRCLNAAECRTPVHCRGRLNALQVHSLVLLSSALFCLAAEIYVFFFCPCNLPYYPTLLAWAHTEKYRTVLTTSLIHRTSTAAVRCRGERATREHWENILEPEVLREHRPSPNASIIELLNDFLQCKLAMQL